MREYPKMSLKNLGNSLRETKYSDLRVLAAE